MIAIGTRTDIVIVMEIIITTVIAITTVDIGTIATAFGFGSMLVK